MLTKIEAARARQLLCSLPVERRAEAVPLAGALGRVLAGDVYAHMPVPPFDRSPYDGYAFRAEDTAGASSACPADLAVTEELPAGAAPSGPVGRGQAVKVLTGAPIPPGADAVVKYEDTEFKADRVRLFCPVLPGTNVVSAGEDVADGALLAPGGTVLSPGHLGLLAGQGLAQVRVWRKPRVSLLSTGSELRQPGTALGTAQIYDSGLSVLGGYLSGLGAVPRNGGIAPDDPALIAGRVGELLENADLVVTTGGASVGDYDWAVRAAGLLGARVLFWKVCMKPGGAMMAAVKDGKLLLGLSGNPAAAAVGLLWVALPRLNQLCGKRDLFPEAVEVRLKSPLEKPSAQLRILRGRLELSGGAAWFAENAGRGSGSVSSLAGCDLLAEVPAGSPPLPAGTKVKAYRV